MFDFELPHLNIIENGEFSDGLMGGKNFEVFVDLMFETMIKKGSRGQQDFLEPTFNWKKLYVEWRKSKTG